MIVATLDLITFLTDVSTHHWFDVAPLLTSPTLPRFIGIWNVSKDLDSVLLNRSTLIRKSLGISSSTFLYASSIPIRS